MKGKRYSVEQIIAAVKQHEQGMSVGDVCRKLGIAEATFYRWKKQYGGLEPDEARELRQLRDENSKLKRTGGRSITGQGHAAGYHIKKVVSVSQRAAVRYLLEHYRISARKACSLAQLPGRPGGTRASAHHRTR